MTPKLIVTAGPSRGAQFPLTDRIIFNIGSDRSSTVFLDDPKVSPNHCRLYREDTKFTLFDVSGRGIAVNGKKVVKAVLSDNDVIRIGESELRFTLAADAPAGVVAPAAGAGAYGQAGPGAYGHLGEGAYGEPAPAGYGQVAPAAYGAAPAGAYGQPVPPGYGPPGAWLAPAPAPYAPPPAAPQAAPAQAPPAAPQRPPEDFRFQFVEPRAYARVWLQCVEGNDKGKIFDLSEGNVWVVGRGHSADVTVMDITVSRARWTYVLPQRP